MDLSGVFSVSFLCFRSYFLLPSFGNDSSTDISLSLDHQQFRGLTDRPKHEEVVLGSLVPIDKTTRKKWWRVLVVGRKTHFFFTT